MSRARAEEQAVETARRIVEATYLRVLCKLGHRDPARLTEGERADLLEPWQAAVEHDVRLHREVIRQAQIGTADGIHAALHAAPGIDHEMLDQAVEYAGRAHGKPVKP